MKRKQMNAQRRPSFIEIRTRTTTTTKSTSTNAYVILFLNGNFTIYICLLWCENDPQCHFQCCWGQTPTLRFHPFSMDVANECWIVMVSIPCHISLEFRQSLHRPIYYTLSIRYSINHLIFILFFFSLCLHTKAPKKSTNTRNEQKHSMIEYE